MKILVLSCNTGEGHNAAGRAMVEWARLLGHEAEMVDMMGLAGPRVSKMVGGAYVETVRCAPRVFHALYCAGGKLSSSERRSPVYYANRLVAEPLLRYLEKHPADVILSPHLFPAETLTYIKEKGLASLPVLAVSTDYTCIPFWEETRCDGYILPHPDLMEEYVHRGIPAEKLFHLAFPCGRPFRSRKPGKKPGRSAACPRTAKPIWSWEAAWVLAKFICLCRSSCVSGSRETRW